MRTYQTFPDALNELKRDVSEMGHRVHPQTMQDKDISLDDDYQTLEYNNMVYTVTQPSLGDLHPHVKTLAWCEAEFVERMNGVGKENEPEAWRLRPEVWSEFVLSKKGLGYTYGERYRPGGTGAIENIIGELREHPDSRQLFLPVWWPVDNERVGRLRVPCSLGYWFALRQGKLHVTYLQRSADYFTHLANDQYLTHKLQRFIAEEIGAQVGMFTHWIGSLHVYKKDVADVF